MVFSTVVEVEMKRQTLSELVLEFHNYRQGRTFWNIRDIHQLLNCFFSKQYTHLDEYKALAREANATAEDLPPEIIRLNVAWQVRKAGKI